MQLHISSPDGEFILNSCCCYCAVAVEIVLDPLNVGPSPCEVIPRKKEALRRPALHGTGPTHSILLLLLQLHNSEEALSCMPDCVPFPSFVYKQRDNDTKATSSVNENEASLP